MAYIREYIHNQIRAPAQYTTISKVHDKKYTKSYGPTTATIRTTAAHPSPSPANAKTAHLHIVENTSIIKRSPSPNITTNIINWQMGTYGTHGIS